MDPSDWRPGDWRPARIAPEGEDVLAAISGVVWTSGEPTVVIATRLDEQRWTESYSDDTSEFTTEQVLGWMPMPKPPAERVP